jgi:hypothetical protein
VGQRAAAGDHPMKTKPVYEQLPGLRFKPNKNCVAFIEEFYTYDEDHLVVNVGYDGIKDNVAARMRPNEARALARWILQMVGDD